MRLTRAIDGLLYAALTRGWPRARVENYVALLKVDDEDSPVPNVVGRTFQVIDAKASGVLTHTSMMIAALGVASGFVADSRGEQAVIVAEIALYLLVAVGCLRCMEIFDEHAGAKPPPAEMVRDEIILRRQLFMFCNRAAIVLTALMFISLPLLFAYVPEKN
jgi:hypothetical protein